MGKFDDFLKGFEFDPATFNAETFQQAITAAHSEDLAADLAIRDAKIQSVEKERDTFKEESDALKIKNYDLLMKIPTKGGGDNTSGQNGGSGNEGNIPDIDDFFHD